MRDGLTNHGFAERWALQMLGGVERQVKPLNRVICSERGNVVVATLRRKNRGKRLSPHSSESNGFTSGWKRGSNELRDYTRATNCATPGAQRYKRVLPSCLPCHYTLQIEVVMPRAEPPKLLRYGSLRDVCAHDHQRGSAGVWISRERYSVVRGATHDECNGDVTHYRNSPRMRSPQSTAKPSTKHRSPATVAKPLPLMLGFKQFPC
jgi:hypothetical protein